MERRTFYMNRKNKIILTTILVALLTTVLVGSYAFFTNTTNNNRMQTANLKTGTMALTFEDNDNGINKQLTFGESVTKRFKIINIGTADASLSLDFDQMVNTYLNGSLSYNLSYSADENASDDEYVEIISETNMPVSSEPLSQTLAPELSVPAGDTYYYNLTITLNDTDFDQEDDLDAVYNTKFNVSDPIQYRYYTLTVDPNGGTWNGFSIPHDYQLKNNETLNIEGTPSKANATFLGWKVVGVSSRLENNVFTMGTGNAKIIAQWDIDKYNLTVNLDGGHYDETLPTEVEYGSSIELKIPTKEGYTFTGWETSVGSINGNTFTLDSASDAVITAKWTPNSYSYKVIHRTMNISGSGYTEIDSETGSLEYGKTLTPAVKTYEGFTSPSGKTITIGTGDNTVTYDYARNQYTVTIDPDGGSYTGNKTLTLYYEATANIPDPTKSGYTFGGWEVSKGTLSGTTYTCGSGNATLTATWVPNTYKYIVYHDKMNVNGSGYTTAESTPGEGAFGSTVTPNTKTYTGFTSPSKRGLQIKVDTNDPPTINTLTYQYSRNQYTLTIDSNGGSYSGTNPGKMYYGASVTLGTPTRTGYKFTGWTKTTGTGATLSGSTFTMGSSNATVTASWTINKYAYTVKHMQENANDDDYTTITTENSEANYGATVTPGVKTYEGFDSPSASSVTIQVDTTKNVIEYKYKRKKFTLTINPNGGSYNGSTGYTSLTLKYNQSITLATPTRTGYSYEWDRTVTGTGNIGSIYTMGMSDDVIRAVWTANPYTVTFNANGGMIGSSSTSSKQVTYNSTYGTLPTPAYNSVTGYTFLGWFTDRTGGTQVTSSTRYTTADNTTLYAHWQPAMFNVAQAVTAIKNNATVKGVKTGNPTFANVATSDEGVYSLADDYGTSYYYRGAVENNYVQFAGFWWRIIRVNGDGSVRMIYDGTQAWPNGEGVSTFTASGTDRFTHTGVRWNTYSGDAKYVGWMYGGANGTASTQRDGTTSASATYNQTNSNVKTQVDSWYKTNIVDKGFSKYVSDEIFCNDRSLGGSDSTYTNLGYGTNPTYYAARSRFYSSAPGYVDGTPKFKCTQKNDAFTVSDTAKGNGALTYPVGLITADEIVAAGGKFLTTNRYYYLYKTSSYWYWSLSPNSMGTYGSAYVFYVDASGYLDYDGVNDGGAVAPVINLSAEYSATLTGSGTTSDPYQLPDVAAVTLTKKANAASVTNYTDGKMTEMYTFSHPATGQTDALTDYRYIGSNPNNYVDFNDETWRIIGVFTVETESGKKEQLIKIIRDEAIGSPSWSSSGSNNWNTSSLKTLLNDNYYNQTGSYTSTSSVKGLNSTARSQVESVKWYLGGSDTTNISGTEWYSKERGTAVYSGNPTSTIQKVGLMYPSDYLYTFANGINNTVFNGNGSAGPDERQWLLRTSQDIWTQSHHSSQSDRAIYLSYYGNVSHDSVNSSSDTVRPVVYLSSDVKIVGGNGSSENHYKLGK